MAQPGAVGPQNWTSAIAANMEGSFQLDLHTLDTLGNVSQTPNVWRGVVDTRAPRVSITARSTGETYLDPATATRRYGFAYTCEARDTYLIEQGFECAGFNGIPERGFQDQPILEPLFPDLVVRDTLATEYFVWETSATPTKTMRACDANGNCATAQSAPVTAPPMDATKPLAMVTSPVADS